MKARFLPPVTDLEIESEAIDTWRIENYRGLAKREHGPIFHCGGHPWSADSSFRAFDAKSHMTDACKGEYSCSHLVTMSTTSHFTLSRVTEISRQKDGMLACSSCLFSGTRTTHRYTHLTVRNSPEGFGPQDGRLMGEIAANHRFNAEEGDWGFTRFTEIRRLFAASWEGRPRPMVENDAVNVTAYVRIYKDPTGVLWHSFAK